MSDNIDYVIDYMDGLVDEKEFKEKLDKDDQLKKDNDLIMEIGEFIMGSDVIDFENKIKKIIKTTNK